MLCKFRVSLGSIEASQIKEKTKRHVDYSRCKEGCEIDLPEEVAAILQRRGVIEAVEAKPAKVSGQSK